jgi:hypothetical protein
VIDGGFRGQGRLLGQLAILNPGGPPFERRTFAGLELKLGTCGGLCLMDGDVAGSPFGSFSSGR